MIEWAVLVAAADAVAAGLALVLAPALCFPGQGAAPVAERFARPELAVLAWFVLWLVTLAAFDLYDPARVGEAAGRRAPGAIARATACFAVLVLAGLTALKIEDVSRLFLLLAFVFQGGLAAGFRLALARWAGRRAERASPERDAVRVVLAGEDAGLAALRRSLEEQAHLGLRVVAEVHLRRAAGGDGAARPAASGAEPAADGLSRLARLLDEAAVDEVVLSLPLERWADIEAAAGVALERGKTVHVALPRPQAELVRARVTPLDGQVLLSWVFGPQDSPALLVKRALDVAGAAAGLILLAPLMLLIALAIKLTSPGPVFFVQERVGLHGRRFRMYKFRSMVADAEERLAEVLHLNEMSGPVFKIADDPRVTRVGRFLRRTSLDELPQLWNVLKGDMSLVGPRPPLPREVRCYDEASRRRLSVRPGLTCFWQVNGRNKIARFEDWVELDLQYIRQWSLGLDVAILAKTIPTVLKMNGS